MPEIFKPEPMVKDFDGTLTTFNGLTIIKPSEAIKFGVCGAIYGPGGVGKTTFAAGACESEFGAPVLDVDAEGGASAVSHISESKLSVAPVKSWKEIDALGANFSLAQFPWRTVLFDNMTEYASLALDAAKAKGGRGVNDQPQIQDYGTATRWILAFTRHWRDIARFTGINVVFIAWDSREKDDETGRISQRVNFTPALQSQFPGIVDIVGYLSTDPKIQLANQGGEYLRWLNFSSNPRLDSKFRRSKNEHAKDIPLLIPNPQFAHILDTIKGGKPWPKDYYDQVYKEIQKK